MLSHIENVFKFFMVIKDKFLIHAKTSKKDRKELFTPNKNRKV